MMETKFLEDMAGELSVDSHHIAAAVLLLEGGATIPFIARYRKDTVGHLNEAQLETIIERANEFTSVLTHRANILKAIEQQDKLTDELRAKIETCFDKTTLDDLYLPYKTRRRTKASTAEDRGLAPLADFIMRQLPGLGSIEEFADAFVKPEKSISSPEEAIEGACFICVERFIMNAEIRALLREHMQKEGKIAVRATKNAEAKKTKYATYFNTSEPLSAISSQRLLAILRGAKEGLLRVDLVIDDDQLFKTLLDKYLKEPGSVFEPHIRHSLEVAYNQHLRPTIEKEVFDLVRSKADAEIIRDFCENAVQFLMAPAAGSIPVVGIIPLAKTGCKIAVIDSAGTLLEHAFIEFQEGSENTADAVQTLLDLLEKHKAYALAIVNNKSPQQIRKLVNGTLDKLNRKDAFFITTDTATVSLIAASQFSREEFPELEAAYREAIAVARWVQNPLAELIKAAPRSIAIGQYPHDVNQKLLRDKLTHTIISCVNQIGVNLNTAPTSLLRYVSGLQMGTAQNIVAFRDANGPFQSRAQLLEIDGIGPRVYEQCAGFLRILDGDNPLDATAIHPEAYPVVEQISQQLDIPVAQLIRNRKALDEVKFDEIQHESIGPLVLNDIQQELLKPSQDPRKRFKPPKLIRSITSVAELEEGVETEGIVSNIADFGAFVNIGLEQDGLVHLSELSNRFVKDPREVIQVGEVVKVKIIKVDKDIPRISLSIKALLPPPRKRAPRKPSTKPDEQNQQTSGAETRSQRNRTEAGKERGDHSEKRLYKPGKYERTSDFSKRDRKNTRRKAGSPASRKAPRTTRSGDDGGPLNTLLAEQLAALKDKLPS